MSFLSLFEKEINRGGYIIPKIKIPVTQSIVILEAVIPLLDDESISDNVAKVSTAAFSRTGDFSFRRRDKARVHWLSITCDGVIRYSFRNIGNPDRLFSCDTIEGFSVQTLVDYYLGTATISNDY